MPNSSSLWKASLVLLILVGCSRNQDPSDEGKETAKESSINQLELEVDTFPILTENKLNLTRDYAEKNYGKPSYLLDSIQMVVVHFTVIPTLEQTLELFARDSLASNRTFIKHFSPLNVGIHYVIDRDGHIYSLLPDSIMARHLIGFNHVSIGVENIARDASELTPEQLQSNGQLIYFLKNRHPEIQYLIGHDEYNNDTLAHYRLFKSLDPTYLPYDKPDPGVKFMADLRQLLKSEYELEFLD